MRVSAVAVLVVVLVACGGRSDPVSDGGSPASAPDVAVTEPATSSVPGDSQPGPPVATMVGGGGSLDLETGSSCWSDGSGAGLCVDTVGPGDRTPGLAVAVGEQLTVRFDTDAAPRRAEVSVWPVDDETARTEVALAATNPTSYRAGLEPGSYYFVLFSVWDRGDASYHARLDVS